MSRVRATALVLVNWKGVFYERYLLDPHVTALEGSNGAGKTTVMIAAYIVLLPDMTRLRFTNLGESGATGGDRGIWGRLGELGRPSYAALELELGEERLLLGVCLNRSSEPTVEPTAFIVRNLAATTRLSEFMLLAGGDGDYVPDLNEIKAAVAGVGASLQVYRTTRDYFAALFECGITPLRLTGEEERSKWNDLLRTSMTGGMSRALGSELRSFLLREESGLSETLSRMRQNLESCRRTRLEVAESRELEREISGVYEAGLAMFAAALHAARLQDGEAQTRVGEAEVAVERAEASWQGLRRAAEQAGQHESAVGRAMEERRSELARLQARKQRAVQAGQLQERLVELEAECLAVRAEVSQKRARQQEKAVEREANKAARALAMEAYDRASVGLSNLQAGLEELSRRAHAHKQLQQSLLHAQAFLGGTEVVLDEVPSVLADLTERRATVEAARARLSRLGQDLLARREEAARATAALQELEWALGDRCLADSGNSKHARARALLAQHAELQGVVARAPELERDRQQVEQLLQRQTKIRALAESLSLPVGLPESAEALMDALTAAERELQEVEEQLQPDPELAMLEQELVEQRKQLAALEPRAARFALVQEALGRLLEAGIEAPRPDREGLLQLRDGLVGEQLALRTRREELEAEREQLLAQAAELGRGAAFYDAELLRVRDELGAELLATRFEDLEPGQAGWVEARLGPWVNALVVDDPKGAAEHLAELRHSLGTVHLVRAGHSLDLAPPQAVEEGLLVTEEPYGARVTKLPSAPSLGRRARETKLQILAAALEEQGSALEQVASAMQRNAACRRDSDVLWTYAEAWLGDDPGLTREKLQAAGADLQAQIRTRQQAQQAARLRRGELRERAEKLRRLLPDAQLLAPPDHAERAQELTVKLQQAVAGRSLLAECAVAQATLAELLDVLRSPPPDDAELAAQAQELQDLEAELDRMFQAQAALEQAVHLRHAAAFGDAQAALDAQAGLSPALEQQQQEARLQLQATEAAQGGALSAWETATEELQLVQAREAALLVHRQRAAEELAELGAEAGGEAPGQLEAELATAEAELARLQDASQQGVAQRALALERCQRAELDREAARAQQARWVQEAQPAAEAWSVLRQAAEAAGVLHGALAMPTADAHTSGQLQAEAASKRELLLDRVSRARGSTELLAALQQSSDPLTGWQAVRAWLARRVPSQVSAGHDPLLALEQLRDHLDALESRLQRLEGDLRGSSEDVGRGIDVQLRRAQAQVRRLNQNLVGIAFGSIHGIRLDLRRIERMEQILKALREGQAQELLFSSNLPIEDALDEIFRRYGGGGRTMGQRLLDYREYLELGVEIKRKADASWEPANPTRLSTGEAIGVGAALMMVVLTEWERDSNLLGPRHKQGSIRFLFLDEANRLSRDNLGVLFDLCKTLELQLLVAAPEVARADGNTTYRLVRHVTEDGREEVIVSGRRAVAEPESAPMSHSHPAAGDAVPAERPRNAEAQNPDAAAGSATASSAELSLFEDP